LKNAIFILAHHKPWLLWSTLISLAAQDEINFDLHVIYINGDGSCTSREEYDPYRKFAQRAGLTNSQLSNDDTKVLDLLDRLSLSVTLHHHENDQGLDSGAWYALIKSRIWRKYDYALCLMEGVILTGPTVLASLDQFIKVNRPDFLSAGHEKRVLPRSAVTRVPSDHAPTTLDEFAQTSIWSIYEIFCRDNAFRALFENWGESRVSYRYPNIATEHHVPSRIYTPIDKLRLLRWNAKANVPLLPNQWAKTERILVASSDKYFLPVTEVSSVLFQYGETIFHKEDSHFFFGCSCQHLFSNRLLENLSSIFETHSLFETAKLPYAGQALEPIWGLIPAWLGYDKWFWNGLHRVRKNFLTLRREDSPEGMARYINGYFYNELSVQNTVNGLQLLDKGARFDLVQKRFSAGPF
jgi:hypothetical protein